MANTPIAGALAPDFRLPCDGGGEVSLNDFRGRKLVIFFYPKADTPGCTSEAIAFSRLRGEFAKANIAILGVSGDPPQRQDAFKAKHQLKVTLASDQSHQTLSAYGVWGKKSMYGKTFMGITRTTVLIDQDGRIARIWSRVRVAGHAAEVLAAAVAFESAHRLSPFAKN